MVNLISIFRSWLLESMQLFVPMFRAIAKSKWWKIRIFPKIYKNDTIWIILLATPVVLSKNINISAARCLKFGSWWDLQHFTGCAVVSGKSPPKLTCRIFFRASELEKSSQNLLFDGYYLPSVLLLVLDKVISNFCNGSPLWVVIFLDRHFFENFISLNSKLRLLASAYAGALPLGALNPPHLLICPTSPDSCLHKQTNTHHTHPHRPLYC